MPCCGLVKCSLFDSTFCAVHTSAVGLLIAFLELGVERVPKFGLRKRIRWLHVSEHEMIGIRAKLNLRSNVRQPQDSRPRSVLFCMTIPLNFAYQEVDEC